jgi:LacI family transcriptional regulator
VHTAGFVGDAHPAHEERRRSFIAQAAAHGIETRPEWQWVDTASATPAGLAGTRALLQRPRQSLPRALVAASDAIAIGVLRALQEAAIATPAQMAVTGFDDIPFADALTPAFGWVTGQPPGLAPAPGRRVLLPGELVVRESA